MNSPGYCIYIDALREGPVPLLRDAEGKPYVFATRLEAQREIAEDIVTRLQEFIDGRRDFEDAMTVEEYIVEVDVLPDGSVIDADDHFWGRET
jgi:hypothetical protein